jgi:hypothetical protein
MGKTRAFLLSLLLPAAVGSAAVHDCDFHVDTWITDTAFQPVPNGEFKVLTGRDGRVLSTNPGGFYLNALVTADANIPNLTVTLDIPADFAPWGNNPVHAYLNDFDLPVPDDEDAIYAGDSLSFGPVNLAAGDRLYLTLHVRYAPGPISAGYLPRTYAFSATASAIGMTDSDFSTLTGILKK